MRLRYKHIEASREVRMWIGQIIIPTISGIMILCPEARDWARKKLISVKNSIASKINKESK